MIAAFDVPEDVAIAATSDWLIPLCSYVRVGPEAVPLIGVLAFYDILNAMKTNAHYVCFALGKPNVATYLVIDPNVSAFSELRCAQHEIRQYERRLWLPGLPGCTQRVS